MAKRTTKPKPTFEVRLKGRDIVPEKVPLRSISDALSSVQRIASGADVESEASSPHEHTIGLLDIKRGSAVFQCVARNPDFALSNIRSAGLLLHDGQTTNAEKLEFAIRPIARLSDIARSLDCEVVVQTLDKKVLASFDAESYDCVARRLLVRR